MALPQRRSDLSTVQALRGVAALLVVAYHAVNTWSLHALDSTAGKVWPNGSAGVDIFFVISGLVMVLSADRLAGRPDAWRTFARQRIVRIVPLYWVMTTAKVAAVLAVLPSPYEPALTCRMSSARTCFCRCTTARVISSRCCQSAGR